MKTKKDKNQPSKKNIATSRSLRVAPQQLGAGRQFGLAVDNRRPVAFFLDGKKYLGFHGDNLAAALLANQQKFLTGSLLYHRPRGMLADKFYESNGFINLGNPQRHGFDPAIAVADLPLIADIKLHRTRHPDKFSSTQFFNKTREAVSALPKPISQPARLSKNLGNRLARAVGTSNKDGDANQWRDSNHRALGLMNSFTGKNFATTSGRFWTGFLRQMMGHAPAPLVNPAFQYMGRDTASHVFYDNQHHHHDVVLVGGGAGGGVALQSLLAKLGKSHTTIAVISNEAEEITMAKMTAAIGKAAARLRLDPRVSWFFSTTAVTCKKLKLPPDKSNGDNQELIEIIATSHHHHRDKHPSGEILWQEQHHVFHCRAIILATGKSEQLLPFDNNDLPGVMGFGNAIKLLKMYGVKPGHHAVVITNNDSIYHQLGYLHDSGVSLSAVIDVRKNINPSLHAMAHDVGTKVYEFYYPKRARALYSQSAPTIFPRSIGKAMKIIGRLVRTDDPTVVSVLAVQQLDETAPASTPSAPLSSPASHKTQSKKQKPSAEIYPPASKIVLARPDQTDEALSAETEKNFNSDCLLISGGFQPRLSLFTQLLPKDKNEGDCLVWSESLQTYLPQYWPAQVFLVGAVGGCFASDNKATTANKKTIKKTINIMADDVAAEVVHFLNGKNITNKGNKGIAKNRDHYHNGFTIMPHRFLPDTQHLGRNSFIDHQYDIKLSHVHGAFAAGYHTPHAIKHYSKLGFGFDRGLGGLSLALAHLYGNKLSTTKSTAPNQATDTMQNIITHNNIFDELHGMAHPTALGAIAHLPLDGRQFFNQIAIKEEMPLYPLTHRPKFFNVIMHPENNLSNNHGAQVTLEDGKKIANYYPYNEGDAAAEACLEEKQNIMSGVGFVDGSGITTIKIIGKRAMDFLQFLSATKITTNKAKAGAGNIFGAGGVTLLNPRDGLMIGRGRYILQADGSLLLTLPLRLPTMTQLINHHHVAQFIGQIARVNKFSLAVIDDSEQWATLRLVGRGVGLLLSQFYNNQILEKTFGKKFVMPKSFSKEEKEKLDDATRQALIKNLPLNQAQMLDWQGFSFLLSRRRFLPAYYIGGMVADVEITCQAHQAVALYQKLWQSLLTAPQLAEAMTAMGYQHFGLGNMAMDYWRLLKGEWSHGAVGEIDGSHSLYDYRLNDMVRAGKFIGRDEAAKDYLEHKTRERLCGFIATLGNLDGFANDRQQGVIRAGSIIQEIDKEPLAQGHGIGHITTAAYCPIRKKYIALGFVMPAIDKLSGKWKDPFGQEVMIADPLFRTYQRAMIVPHYQLGLPESPESKE